MSQESNRYVVPPRESLEWITWNRKNKVAFAAIPNDAFTKYGLLPCSKIEQIPNASKTLWYGDVFVEASTDASAVAAYLLDNSEL